MKTYTVIWKIEVASVNPQAAAKAAFQIMQNPDTIATVFEVKEFDGQKKSVVVDLLDNSVG